MSNVAVLEKPAARSVLIDMATRYGREPAAFESTLRATVVPKDCSREQFAAFLLVAKEYELNPVLKEIYAFPTRGGGIQPIVSIDGWMNLINSHPAADGIEFDDHLNDKGELTAITARVWRKDRNHPVVVTEYMDECKRATEPWKQWPRRMLRHKAAIQGARYAFGFASIVDPDEAERMGADAAKMRDVSPPKAPPSPPSAPKAIAKSTEPAHDPATGEITEPVLLPSAESAQLKAGMIKRLRACATSAAVTKWSQDNADAIATLQPVDREDVATEWDSYAADLAEREQSAEAEPVEE
jgi:phage recombination protein Bet